MEKSRFILFTGLVNSVTKSIQAMKMMKMERYGLSAAHTNCLCRLAERPEGLTQGELAELEMTDKAQVSRVLRELEEKGYVYARGRAGSYKRRYLLTDRGEETTREMEAILLAVNRYVSREIPPEDLAVFYRTMTTIAKNIRGAEVLMEEGKEGILYEQGETGGPVDRVHSGGGGAADAAGWLAAVPAGAEHTGLDPKAG